MATVYTNFNAQTDTDIRSMADGDTAVVTRPSKAKPLGTIKLVIPPGERVALPRWVCYLDGVKQQECGHWVSALGFFDQYVK